MTIKIYSGRTREKEGNDGINDSGPVRRIEPVFNFTNRNYTRRNRTNRKIQIIIHSGIIQICRIIQIYGIIQICGIIQINGIIQFLEIIQIGVIGVIGIIIIELVKEMILKEEDIISLEMIFIIFHNSKGSQKKVYKFIRNRDFEGAITLLEHEKLLNKDNLNIQLWLAYSYYHSGDFPKTLSIYRNLTKKASYDLNIHTYIACCLYALTK